MNKLIVRDLSEPQLNAFGALFPALHRAGLVAQKGRTGLVVTVHSQVFRKHPERAGEQLAASARKLWARGDGPLTGVQPNTVQGLQRKLLAAVVTQEV